MPGTRARPRPGSWRPSQLEQGKSCGTGSERRGSGRQRQPPAHADLRYTSWLCAQIELGRLDSTEGWLCPGHLLDAFVLDSAGASRVAEFMRAYLTARLDRLAEHLADIPSRHVTVRLSRAVHHVMRRQWTQGKAVWQRTRAFIARALAMFNSTAPQCTVCATGRLAERRARALLEVALGHRLVRDQWERGQGVCADHVGGFADPLPRSVWRSRVRLLAWELEEAQRKTAWRTHNEPTTAAETSWPRAIPLLCGGTYLGHTLEEVRGCIER